MELLLDLLFGQIDNPALIEALTSLLVVLIAMGTLIAALVQVAKERQLISPDDAGVISGALSAIIAVLVSVATYLNPEFDPEAYSASAAELASASVTFVVLVAGSAQFSYWIGKVAGYFRGSSQLFGPNEAPEGRQ